MDGLMTIQSVIHRATLSALDIIHDENAPRQQEERWYQDMENTSISDVHK